MRILTIGDNPKIFTGLARVHRHVITALIKAGHEVIPCIWFGYDSKQHIAMSLGEKPPPLDYNGTIMLDVHKRGKDKQEMKDIYNICEALKPDVIFTIGDHYDFYYMHALKGKLDYSFKWIAYLTTEVPPNEDFRPLFLHADKIIVPSKHSKGCLDGICEAEVVPFGVENNFFKKKIEHQGKRFVTVATNTWRKDLPILLQGISLLKNEWKHNNFKNCSFYIHTNTYAAEANDPFYFDLKLIAAKLKIDDIVSFPESNSVISGITDEKMANIYAESDFFITPSICESFAFPVVEAMAAGLPAIGNDNGGESSAIGEHIANERGLSIPSEKEFFPPCQEVRRVSVHGVGVAILRALEMNSETYDKMSKGSTAYAREFEWEKTEKRICDIVSSMNVSCEIPVEIVT